MLEWFDQFFLSSSLPYLLLSMTLTGTYVTVAVLLLRFLFLKAKAPAWARYALWAAPLFRLLCPYTPTASWSPVALPSQPVVEGKLAYTPALQTGLPLLDQQEQAALEIPASSANPGQILFALFFLLWALGVTVQLGYGIWKHVALRRRLATATLMEKRVYECQGLSTAFVRGLIRPRIYLPLGLSEEQRRLVLLHERAHLRHLDPLWRFLAWTARCIHWINPLVWIAFRLSGQDMESACDEWVLTLEGDGKARSSYSAALLACVPSNQEPPLPLAFGESHPARRIRQVLSWRKPSLWMAATAAVLVALILAGLATSRPAASQQTLPGWQTVEIAFPANENGKDEYTAAFFDAGFKLHMVLPEGWRVSQPTEEDLAQSTAQRPAAEDINTVSGLSPVMLLNEQGQRMGSVGFYPFSYYSEAGEKDPETYPLRAVYNEYLSNMFQLVWLEEGQSWVTASGSGVTTLCPMEFFADGYMGERPNAPSVVKRAVLSYDFDLERYVVIVLEKELMSQEQEEQIAKSVALSPMPS